MNEDRERLGHSGLEDVRALDDGLVNTRTALHVVGLDRKKLLKRVGHAVRLESPHFHFAHTLTAELRLAAERLLGDERVGADGTGMDLVGDEVVELEHVDDADDDLLLEGLARKTVIKNRLALGADPALGTLFLLLDLAGLEEKLVDLGLLNAVEHGRRGVEVEVAARKTEVGLKKLTEVHARRHAERVQNDVDRAAVGKERHVAARKNARDDTLVAVTSGHLVADRKVLLVDEENAYFLDDFAVAAEIAEETAVGVLRSVFNGRELGLERIDDRGDLVLGGAVLHLPVGMSLGENRELRALDFLVGGDDDVARLRIGDVAGKLLVHDRVGEFAGEILLELGDLVLALLLGVLLGLLGRLVVGDDGVLTGRNLNAHDDAGRTRRYGERRVADIGGLLAEDGSQKALFGAKLGLALGRNLTDENVAGLDFGTDADDAVGTEVLESVLGDVGDIAGDLFGAELRVARAALEGYDVKRRENVLADDALVDEDGVLEVVAAPAHERHEEVLAEREFALVGRGTVGEAVAELDLVALLDDRSLVEARAGVAAAVLLEVVSPDALCGIVLKAVLARRKLAVVRDDDEVGRNVGDRTVGESGDDDARVLGAGALETRTDERTLGTHERHALTHHVRAHERTVGVVVLEERNETGGDRDDLHRGDVHILDLACGLIAEFGLEAAGYALFGERAVGIERRVGLGDYELLFGIRGKILDLVGDLTADNLAVGSFDEAEAVDAGVDAERRDKTDVRTFGRLDRADAAVVGRMDVADLEACALAGETAGTESRETALVGESRQGVRLVHELRKLAAGEEVLNDRAEGLGVDETARRERPGRLGVVNGHALADETLGTRETDAALVLEKFARRADAAVAEVVDIVDRILADENLEKKTDRLDDVDTRLVQSAEILVDLAGKPELLIDLVAADIAEIVMGKIEEETVDHLLRVSRGRRIAGTHALVDLLKRVLLVVDAGLGVFAEGDDKGSVVDGDVDDLNLGNAGGGDLLHHRGGDGIVAAGDDGLGIAVDEIVLHDELAQFLFGVFSVGRKALEIVEEIHELLVGAVAERAQKRRRVEFAAAAALIHEAPHDVVRIEHDLDPAAAVGNDTDGKERLAVCVDLALGRNAGRAVELGDDDALRAVDDERAVGSHDRHIAEEHFLLADILVILKTESRVKRTGISLAIHESLKIRLLRRLKSVAYEIEIVAALVGDDWENLFEDRLKALVLALGGRHIGLEEIFIRFRLDCNQVGRSLGHALKLAEYFAFCAHLRFTLFYFLSEKVYTLPYPMRLKCGKRPLC